MCMRGIHTHTIHTISACIHACVRTRMHTCITQASRHACTHLHACNDARSISGEHMQTCLQVLDKRRKEMLILADTVFQLCERENERKREREREGERRGDREAGRGEIESNERSGIPDTPCHRRNSTTDQRVFWRMPECGPVRWSGHRAPSWHTGGTTLGLRAGPCVANCPASAEMTPATSHRAIDIG